MQSSAIASLSAQTIPTSAISAALTAVMVSSLIACTDPDDTSAEAFGSYSLSDGTTVRVLANGSISLFDGERELITIADTARPIARAFDRSTKTLLGSWEFPRYGETTTEFTTFQGASTKDGGVEIVFGGPIDSVARLHIKPLVLGASTLIRVSVEGESQVNSIAIPLRCDADSSYYGFGEQYNKTDQRGEAFPLFVTEQGIGRPVGGSPSNPSGNEHTTYFPMPYFMDARGMGALVHTDQRSLVDLCKSDPNVAWIEVEDDAPLDLVIYRGPTPKDVIRQLGDELGRPKPLPAWAYGLWVAAQGGRDMVLAEATALKTAGIPATAIWAQDWTGPRMNIGGGFGVQYRWVEDPITYPDLAGMVTELHGMGYKFLAYVNPFVMPGLEHYDAMEAAGHLIRFPSGKTFVFTTPAGDGSHPDLTKSAAREYVKDFFRTMVKDKGIDGWMADFGEWQPTTALLESGEDPFGYHNRYPTEWHKLSREVMDELRPDGDYAVFTRSGFTGEQGVAQIVWAGDQEATWSPTDGLPTVVPALLNLGLSGIPFVTHDIAGFSGGPSTKELFQRWTELGAFTPVMRTHEGNMKDKNWSWEKDAETTAHFKRFTLIHQALAKEFAALAEEAALTSMPIVRHLMLEFPEDLGSRQVSDEFLVGPNLLVAPVVVEGAVKRSVYLPPGGWFDVWTGTQFTGGMTIEMNAPIGSPPVFSRDKDRDDLRLIQ